MDEAIINNLSSGIATESQYTINELLELISIRIANLQAAVAQYGLHETQQNYLNRSVSTIQKFFTTDDIEQNMILQGFTKIAEAVTKKDIYALRTALQEWKDMGFRSDRTRQIQSMAERYNSLQEASDNIFTENKRIEYDKLEKMIQDTYKFLNLIGETIRGRQIFYEVNYINEKTKQIFSGYLTLDQILQYSTLTANGSFKLNTSLLKQGFANQSFLTQEWNKERADSFWRFQERALKNEKNVNLRFYSANDNSDKDYLNLGNVMEAFRYGEQLLLEQAFPNITEVSEMIAQAHWKRVYAWMARTIKNNAAYLTGGDIQANLKLLFSQNEEFFESLVKNNFLTAEQSIVDLQLKNINAGLTSIDSLIVQLTHLQNILLKSTNKEANIKQLLQKSNKSGVEAEIQKDLEKMFSQSLSKV